MAQDLRLTETSSILGFVFVVRWLSNLSLVDVVRTCCLLVKPLWNCEKTHVVVKCCEMLKTCCEMLSIYVNLFLSDSRHGWSNPSKSSKENWPVAGATATTEHQPLESLGNPWKPMNQLTSINHLWPYERLWIIYEPIRNTPSFPDETSRNVETRTCSAPVPPCWFLRAQAQACWDGHVRSRTHETQPISTDLNG